MFTTTYMALSLAVDKGLSLHFRLLEVYTSNIGGVTLHYLMVHLHPVLYNIVGLVGSSQSPSQHQGDGRKRMLFYWHGSLLCFDNIGDTRINNMNISLGKQLFGKIRFNMYQIISKQEFVPLSSLFVFEVFKSKPISIFFSFFHSLGLKKHQKYSSGSTNKAGKHFHGHLVHSSFLFRPIPWTYGTWTHSTNNISTPGGWKRENNKLGLSCAKLS